MTSLAPDNRTATLPIVVVIDETGARHRTAVLPVPNLVPAWVQLVVTVIAFAAGAVGVRATASAEQLVVFGGVAIIVAAVMILAAVFAPDIDAAVRARIDAKAAGE